LKKISTLFIVQLMLLGALLINPSVHAATGIVSINGGSPVQVSQSATTVSVPIQISGSDALNAFDIQVFADSSLLTATGVSLFGSVLSNSPTIVLECINGVLVAGTSCSTNDGPGVVHLSVVQTSLTCVTTGCTTTGVLFTINYNIVGQTTGTPINFNTGCSKTSTGTSDCVTIANGNPNQTPVPELDQATTFSNLIDFTMTPVFPNLSTPSGMSITDVINYVAIGGYQDILTETCSATTGLTCTLKNNSVDLTSSTTGSDTLTVTGTMSGSVTVNATGQNIFFPGVPHRSHLVIIPVAIQSPDFSVSLSQSKVTVSAGSSDSSTNVNAQGFGGFSGTVSFASSTVDSSNMLVSGITGTAPTVTLTNDGSGYSTASSPLTVSVSSTVQTGNYTLTATGTSGSTTHTAAPTLTVSVPGQDFSVVAVPNSITIVRGGTVSAVLSLASLGNFAGTVTFTATVTPVSGQQDSCCLTNNITPGFSPASATLTAGGTGFVAFTATSIGGTAPASTYTATGNYTLTIIATSGSLSHPAVITFNIIDFSIGPSFCPGNNFVQTTPDSLDATVFTNTTATGGDIAGQFIGTPCNSLTITDQPNVLFPYFSIFSAPAQVLYVQANALGGLVTNGFDGLPSISSLNPALPFNGITVPQLASVVGSDVGQNKACMVPTFANNDIFASNGTKIFSAGQQIPYSYLAQNGPLILPSSGLYPLLGVFGIVSPNLSHWGCRFDNAIYPRDVGNNPELNAFENSNAHGSGHFGICPPNFDPTTPCDYQNILNPDFWGVTAMALQGTLAGSYSFQQCGQGGVIKHCNTYGLNVVHAPVVTQISYTKKLSVSKTGGVQNFKLGVTNKDTQTIFAQVTVTAIGSFGDSFTVTSPVLTIAPLSTATNIALSFQVTSSMIGETFSFSTSIAVGLDSVNLDGSSTEASGAVIHSSFTVVA
jgi:hypothetical protein